MARGGKRDGAGRPVGAVAPATALLRDAILKAGEAAGGKAGLTGYLKAQAIANPGPFMSLLGKVLPMQIAGDPNAPLIHEIRRTIIDPQSGDA